MDSDINLDERTTPTQTPARNTDSDLTVFSPVNIEALKQESQEFASSSSVQGVARYTRPEADENTSLLSSSNPHRSSYSNGETDGDANASADAEANLYSVYQGGKIT